MIDEFGNHYFKICSTGKLKIPFNYKDVGFEISCNAHYLFCEYNCLRWYLNNDNKFNSKTLYEALKNNDKVWAIQHLQNKNLIIKQIATIIMKDLLNAT